MADDKTIVTKKTAPKTAAETKKTVAKKTVTKKTVTKTSTSGQDAGLKATAPRQGPVRAAASALKTAPTKKAPDAPSSAATAPKPPGTAAKTSTAAPRSKKVAPKTAGTGSAQLEGKAISLQSLANVSDEERLHMVHEAAYYRAEKRNFAPGHEVEDWAEAEREIDELIGNAKRISGR
jgi:hypothetical protein